MHLELNRVSIDTLVREFYADVRRDPAIASVFSSVIGENWAPHQQRMVDFWSTVMLGTNKFKGNVYGRHMLINNVQPEHFSIWLNLFEQHVRRLFARSVADEFLTVAHRIGASLQFGFFGRVVVP